MGAHVLSTVESWPRREGLRTSDLIDLDNPLRTALLRLVRIGEVTVALLGDDLGVPEEDATRIAGALVEAGALAPPVDGAYRLRRPAPRAARPRPWLDVIDGGGA